MKWVYIKNGNVVSQVHEIGFPPRNIPTSGPNAFLAGFLDAYKDDEFLLISKQLNSYEFETTRLTAKVFSSKKSKKFSIIGILFPFFLVIKTIYLIYIFSPDCILCGSRGYFHWTCCIMAKLLQKPYVRSCHGGIIERRNFSFKKILNYFDIIALKAASGVVCHGPHLKDELLRIGIPEKKVFEFEVDLHDFVLNANSTTTLPDAVLNAKNGFVLFVGRIVASKGIFDLLEAMRQIIRNINSPQLIYIGEGNDLQKIKNKILKFQLEKKVICLGKIPHEQVAVIIKRALCTVTPTRSSCNEGRCMTALESIVLGVPLIAPNYGPFPYLVKHNTNGMLYKPDSIEDLKEKIETVLDNEYILNNLRKGAKASGAELLDQGVRFYQAVTYAFDSSKSEN